MNGTLGMIVCPMLEDELIFNVENDPEIDNVYVVDTPFTETLIPKLRQHRIEYEMIGQKEALSPLRPEKGYSVMIWTMFLGLHEDPEILFMEVCNQIIQIKDCVDSIMIYYGRCGRALDNIDRWVEEHNIEVPISIFRNPDGTICDDCICIPVGGTERYLNLLKKHPGKIYLTPAMASNFEGFITSMELFNGIDVNNKEIMKMLLEMADYEVALTVQTGRGDQENYQRNVENFCKEYNLKNEILEDGWTTDDLVVMNYRNAKNKIGTKKG